MIRYDDAEGLRRLASEAQAKADELNRRARELEDGTVVQVTFSSGEYGLTYAYKVPDGLSAPVGSQVVVKAPGGLRVVRVVSVGRGSYDGPLKSLVGRVITQDEDEGRDPVDIGFGSCPDCGYAYHWEGQSPCNGVTA